MSGFTPESFTHKLAKLSESQQSIQTLSHWVQYHKKACNESAATWSTEALRASPSRQLLFIYLVNDIMQNSRRKGPEFVKAYGDRLTTVFPRVFSAASSPVQAKLLRMLNIWEERRVLSNDMLNELRQQIGADGPSPAAVAPSSHSAAARPAAASLAPDDDEEYVPTPMSAPAAPTTGGGSGIALADLLVTLDQGSLVDEVRPAGPQPSHPRSADP